MIPLDVAYSPILYVIPVVVVVVVAGVIVGLVLLIVRLLTNRSKKRDNL